MLQHKQPPDEWKEEQGMAAAVEPLLDQTLNDAKALVLGKGSDQKSGEEIDIEEEDSRDVTFAEERPGWGGYIEWENYPEKKAKAAAILARHSFPPPPEFQLGPLPDTNPVLEGVRWKMWHRAIGGAIKSVPEESWMRVIEEKHADMLHLLQFPYNGEPPKVCIVR